MKVFRSFLLVGCLTALSLTYGCTKKSSNTSSLYVPTSADVTATATLQDLQQGRALYIKNCNSCHDLPTPDNYGVSSWKSIMSSMGPRTSMTSSEITLVTKYVTRGQ